MKTEKLKEDYSLKIDEGKNVAKLNDVFSNVFEYLGVLTFGYIIIHYQKM